jgi:hypothetical protein
LEETPELISLPLTMSRKLATLDRLNRARPSLVDWHVLACRQARLGLLLPMLSLRLELLLAPILASHMHVHLHLIWCMHQQ